MSESNPVPGAPSLDAEASEAPDVPRLGASLDQVGRWHEGASADLTSQTEELQSEAQGAEVRISELEAELLQLRERQAEIEGRLEELQDLTEGLELERGQRLKLAVVEALESDEGVLNERAEVLDQAEAARRASLESLLDDQEVARLVEEYEQFVEVEPTLELLPAGYRKAILSHHEAVRRRLQPLFEAIERDLEPADVDNVAVSVLGSLDYEDGQCLAAVLVLPVRYEVYKDWAANGEGLQGKLALRVVAAVSGALARLGCADAAIRFSEIDGRLALQAWLADGDGPNGDVKSAMQESFHSLRDSAAELRAVRMSLHLAWVPPETIEALDEGGEDSDAGLDLFEKLSLVEVCSVLDLHPFGLARLLGAEGGLPRDLRFDESEIGRLREQAGVETWWDGGALPVEDEDHQRALIRSLARKVLDRELPGGPATRADNLFRGLAGDDSAFVRRLVNQLIRERLATSAASARGLLFRVAADKAATYEAIAEDGDLPAGLEALCD